jgi:hypothetical protein
LDSGANPDTYHLCSDEFEGVKKRRKRNLGWCVLVPDYQNALAFNPA